MLVLKEGKILLGERLASHGAGTWSLPGGHLEFGETFESAGAREVAEETGLVDIELKGLVCVSNDRVYGKHFVTIGMLAHWKRGEPVAMEPEKAANWTWFLPSELPENLFLPSKHVIDAWLAGEVYL